MTDLEKAAVEFIHARDRKAQAKSARNAVKCTEECSGSHEDAGVPACWRCFNPDIDSEDDLCDGCKERQRLHYAAIKLTMPAQKSLARLRSIVRKLDKK